MPILNWSRPMADCSRRLTRVSRRKPEPRETQLVAAILEVLTRAGFWCWRVNSGARIVPANPAKGIAKRMIRLAPKGTPDIAGILRPTGRAFHVEVKRPGGKLSDSQREWHAKCMAHGGLVTTETSISGALKTVRAWQKEENIRSVTT